MSMFKNSQKILRSDDAFVLILFIALILGGIVRFMPVAMAGFPVNDGGMFYVMVEELKLNHFCSSCFYAV